MSKPDGRPIAHVAAEAGIARSTLTKWVHRYRDDGIEALQDRSSAPATRVHERVDNVMTSYT